MKLNKKHIKNLSRDKSTLPLAQTQNIAGGGTTYGDNSMNVVCRTDHCWSQPNIFCHAPDPTSGGWKCGTPD